MRVATDRGPSYDAASLLSSYICSAYPGHTPATHLSTSTCLHDKDDQSDPASHNPGFKRGR